MKNKIYNKLKIFGRKYLGIKDDYDLMVFIGFVIPLIELYLAFILLALGIVSLKTLK